MNKLYTVQEVALLFKVHEKTVKSYIDNNELKAAWFGNRWRIRSEEVERFVKDKEDKQGV